MDTEKRWHDFLYGNCLFDHYGMSEVEWIYFCRWLRTEHGIEALGAEYEEGYPYEDIVNKAVALWKRVRAGEEESKEEYKLEDYII